MYCVSIRMFCYIYFLNALSPCGFLWTFFSCGEWGLLCCGAWLLTDVASHRGAFSFGTWAPRHTSFSSCSMKAQRLLLMGSGVQVP